MEAVHKEENPNPAEKACLISKLFFCWLNPLFHIGHKRRIEEDDMYRVLPEDASKRLGEELQQCWDKEVQKARREARVPYLGRAIVHCFWKYYSLLGIVTLAEETVRVVQPLFLGNIINYFEDYNPNDHDKLIDTYGYVVGVSLCSMTLAVSHHIYFYHVQRAGMKLRVAMCHMIYKKALRLGNTALAKTTTGQIVNLLSNDVNKFDQATVFLHYLWIGPLQAVAIVVLLSEEIGVSCVAGMAVLFFLMPLQSCIGHIFSSLRSKTAAFTDSRIRTMNEVISGIRIIKMYAWEKSFAQLVSDIRSKEIGQILKSSYLRGFNLASFFVASKVILFVTFMTYVLLGNAITARRVFVAVSLYNAVRLTVTLFFPSAIEKASEAKISIRRIKNFLLLEETKMHANILQCDESMGPFVQLQDVTCSWNKMNDTPTLKDISFTVRPGELFAVIGSVGAGKSSLLSAVLGEISCSSGTVNVSGKLAYAAQQPWVFPGTVRSNILFGKEYKKQKYEKVIRVCALKKDLEMLEDGDLTVIGDRGVTLSGGQKARINLARAIYQDADIYLLDDPLSAVDAEVGRHLFEQCICGVLRNKCCILVTHQLQYLTAATQILILKDGEMVGKGSYAELLRSGIDFASLLKTDENDDQHQMPLNVVPARNRTLSQTSVWSQASSLHSHKGGSEDQLPAEPVQPFLAEESRAEGSVGFKVFKKYFTAGANWFVLIGTFFVSILSQVTYVLQDWWLSYWAQQQELLTKNSNATNETVLVDTSFYLGIYAGLTVTTVIFGIWRCLLTFGVLVNASQVLHNKMFLSLLHAPVLFFDRNPIGRILNRFSKDIGHLDDLLPLTFIDFTLTSLQILGVIAVAAAVIPWIIIPITPLFIIFIFLRRYFLDTSRDIKRLEATTRSPVFSHLSSSLQGLWTIRAFKAEERFQEIFDAHQDLHSEAWFLFLTTSRWLAVRLDGICAIFVTAVAVGSMLLANSLDAGKVGLALSYAVSLMGMFQWGVRQSAEVESLMTSVERVQEYTELENEAEWNSVTPPPKSWPTEGNIFFDNVNFAYSCDGPLVLKHLTAFIRSKEKIGIVGRTGAGKSSIISALFRLAEPEGKICIDSILTSSLGLHDLRKKMSIIPQDPVLFTGTMRTNLDPFNEHSDEALWNALEEVQLKEVVEELPYKMETELAESGSNFSVGQRQLVCLARAILRKNQILIIDEATANVDPRTDELIQKTIREKFAQCTVLTIAHRLNTIIDSDRILVLDAGRIKEFDEPFVILQNKDSVFYKMVEQTGKAEAAALLETAKQVYMSRSRPEIMFPNGISDTVSGVVLFETAL